MGTFPLERKSLKGIGGITSYRLSDTDLKKTTLLLTSLRLENYPIIKINRLTSTDKENIQNLIKDLGAKVIREELKAELSFTPEEIREATNRFNNIVDGLAKMPTAFPLVTYAGNLLQFYAITCDTEMAKQTTLSKMQTYLNSKIKQYGQTDKNLFVLERKIITAYNEIARLEEDAESVLEEYKKVNATLTRLATSGSEDAVMRAQGKMDEVYAKLGKLNAQLIEIHKPLSQLVKDVKGLVKQSGNNIFVKYLSMVSHYTQAKYMEVYAEANPALASTQQTALIEVQKEALKGAKSDLEDIRQIKEFAETMGKGPAIGSEFAFGRELLRKLPAHDKDQILDEVEEHVSKLII